MNEAEGAKTAGRSRSSTEPDGKVKSETRLIYWNKPRNKESNDDGGFIVLPSGSSEEDKEALQKSCRLKLDILNDGKKGMDDKLDLMDNFPTARKEWVAMVVEECMHTLAAGGLLDFSTEGRPRTNAAREDDLAYQRLRNRFIFRWLVVKIIQTVLGFVAIVLFHHEGSFTSNPEGMLPALVTFYVTVASVLLTTLVYVSSLDILVVKNPHSLLYIITSALLTLISATGVIILLALSTYYQTQIQVLVFFLAVCLEICLFAELYLCYYELKRLWNKIGQSD
ncbi:UNVERIFIED_CONTAM: hypothetical protein PYX00_000486 [Menopon gallinae]|uniref:Uncharacterized protein n=1 Tax=Menopon gallinae TaxID=328185 RepID=A0AAW2I983_9NEOP